MEMKKENNAMDFINLVKSKGLVYKRFANAIDKLGFLHILVIWVFIIVFFGIIYYLFSNNGSYLIHSPEEQIVEDIKNSIYFSFVTATTTGYGDILPSGYFKLITIFEVVFGMLLLALVTSKFVSIKQDIILNELYELSLNERINRLRSSLLLFRQHLTRIITRIEETRIRKREIDDIYVDISSFEDILNEVINIIHRQEKNHFTKVIDSVNTELILNSVLNSFEKLNELIEMMNQNKLEWKRDITIDLVNRCISLNDKLFGIATSQKNMPDKVLNNITTSKNDIVGKTKTLIIK